jgi:hypothetical protein
MQHPFQPIAPTVNVPITGTTARVEVRSSVVSPNAPAVRVANIGTQIIFVTFGDGTVTSTTSAGFPMPAGAVEVFTLPANATHIAAIAGAVGSTLYATLGDGQ